LRRLKKVESNQSFAVEEVKKEVFFFSLRLLSPGADFYPG
jgi:hypothetical protein